MSNHITEYLRVYEKDVLSAMIKFPEKRAIWLNLITKEHILNNDYSFIYDVIDKNKGESDDNIMREIHSNGIQYSLDHTEFLDYTEFESGLLFDNEKSISKIIENKRYRDIMKIAKGIDPFSPNEEDIQKLYIDVHKGAESMSYLTVEDCFSIVGKGLTGQDDSTKPKYTGIEGYDEIIGGFTEGMHILTGRPGSGKSSLADQILTEYSKKNPNKMQVFFSIEMGEKSIAKRVVSYATKINSTKIKKQVLNKAEIKAFLANAESPIDNYVHIPCDKLCVLDAEKMLKKISKESGKEIGLVCFDYFQKMKPNNKNSWQGDDIKEISSDLTEFCKSIPAIVVSNLNQAREGKVFSCPEEGEIKGGSIIAYDATSVMGLWRESLDSKNTFSRMLKNRDDTPGQSATWYFDGAINTFSFLGWGVQNTKNIPQNSELKPF